MLGWFLLGLILVLILGALLYWLLVVTEGVYLGRRLVVWMYDITADRYDGIKQFDEDAERFLVIRPLLWRITNSTAPLILDVATGTGRLPVFLLDEATFNGRVIGLDASARMLAHAQPKLSVYRQRASLVQQTAADLPFPDEVFDAVTCLEALEFFPNDTIALQEMIRVLRPGGAVLVTRRRGWEAKTFIGRYRDRESFETHLSSLGLAEVETLLWQIEYDLVFARKPAALKQD
jgi:ubiquinone/menaquinone biosynthesis C-methylase UbiE